MSQASNNQRMQDATLATLCLRSGWLDRLAIGRVRGELECKRDVDQHPGLGLQGIISIAHIESAPCF